MTVRPQFHPSESTREQETGILVLRDGTRLPLWRALPEDVQRIRALFGRLTGEERKAVLASLELEEDRLERFFEELKGSTGGEAFIVLGPGPGEEVVAFGAYRLVEENTAATTLAVGPEARKMGIGRLLLDRLAVLAAHRGVDHLVGTYSAGHEHVVELFKQAGFAVSGQEGGEIMTFVTEVPSSVEALEGLDRNTARRVFTAASLRPLFHPRSVAVAGASRDPASVGHRILQGLLRGGFEGTVYPVNPKARQVASVKAYPSVDAIEEELDLVVVAVPVRAVPEVVEACGEKGVQALVVVTAGFAEIGEEGRVRQEALMEQVRRFGMRMVGPNCLGVMYTDPSISMNASFAPKMPPAGRVGLCSQSGALGVAIVALARRLELGLSSFVSIGNKADTAADDLLEYWEEDLNTDVLLFYLESFKRPRRFARIARRVGRRKPIVVVKSGRTSAGERAAGSHTAALTADETAVDALFRQTGMIRAESLGQMFAVARCLAEQPLPGGRRFAVITNAGGPAILCADALEGAGMKVEGLSEATREQLDAFLPEEAASGNPVDMIASAGPDTYRRAVEIVLSAQEVDGAVVIYTPVGIFDDHQVAEAITEGVAAAREKSGVSKPIMASIVGEEDEETYLLPMEGGGSIPVYAFPEEIGQVAGKLADYAEWRDSEPGTFPEFEDQDLEGARAICRQALEERGEGWLSVSEAREVLEKAGVPVARGGVASDADEAATLAAEIGFPVAVKLASIKIVHKTELEAVKLGLEDEEKVRRAFREIEDRVEAEGQRDAMQGVLIQPMLEGSAEVMIGVSSDPVFGPVLAFGMGGIYVEVLRDVAFRLCPLTDRDAGEMVREIRGYRLLEGYRGYPPGDVDALEDALLRISRLADTVEEIAELDLNPIFALRPGEGCRVADARIRVG